MTKHDEDAYLRLTCHYKFAMKNTLSLLLP